MTIGSNEGPPPPWPEVHSTVLSTLDALASSTGWIPTAATVGIEPIFERVLQQVCQPQGVSPEAYIDLITRDAGLRRDVQKRLARLMENPALVTMRREAQRREAEHQLQVLHYVISGQEPPEWVWASIDEEQQQQLRDTAESGEERDPVLLPRVQRALQKLATNPTTYGQCEDCGTTILLERLQLVPWAECCAACQRKREGTPDTPPEPQVLVTYF
ncbi:TraR/DksA family transcriptional regulator [Archangium sp.]|uniref:TraR/DksA family transcriptional regulator n=1 Tax=Archangium sp. TaxID=1872627 RepID=UPI002D5C6F8B|nr:TraR/DksA family transcriptional regulator [Archangium sp.]HYO54435.1 TraR/DksA family transcriptional regulator [Archangium sp.]